VVVVVADPILVSGGRSGGLDAADETLLDEGAECVVHGSARHRSDVGADAVGDLVCGRVGSVGYRAEHCETLRGDVEPAFAEQAGRVGVHGVILAQDLHAVKTCYMSIW
jgi:hypothetical protein